MSGDSFGAANGGPGGYRRAPSGTRRRIVARVREVGLVPVLRARAPEEARAMAGALQQAGVPILEITLTVPGALSVIRDLARGGAAAPLVGAGTVLDAAAAEACIEAGAAFIVSPALDVDTIRLCNRREVPVFCGALTPTEVLAAWRAGADMVKIFPAGAIGGPSYLRALRAPLPEIELLPTGGVSLETAAAYLLAGASAIGVGSDLVDLEALRAGDLDRIRRQAQLYLAAVAAARRGG